MVGRARGGAAPPRGADLARARPGAPVHVGGDGADDVRRPLREAGSVMRVGIDVSPLVQTRAGTARYLSALLARNEYEQLSFPGTSRLATAARDAWWYPLALPREARKRGVDVLHCPTFRAPFSTAMPLVVTVLDLAVLRHPGMFNQWSRRYSRFAVSRVMQAAAAVITISEFTKSEVLDVLGTPPEKVHAIPIAVEAPFTPDGPSADGDYVLSV